MERGRGVNEGVKEDMMTSAISGGRDDERHQGKSPLRFLAQLADRLRRASHVALPLEHLHARVVVGVMGVVVGVMRVVAGVMRVVAGVMGVVAGVTPFR